MDSDRGSAAIEMALVLPVLLVVFLAIAEFGLAEGISLYTGVAEVGWLEQILAFGWRAYPLGTPQRIGGMRLGALAIEIDNDTPQLLADAGIGAAATRTREPHHAL